MSSDPCFSKHNDDEGMLPFVFKPAISQTSFCTLSSGRSFDANARTLETSKAGTSTRQSSQFRCHESKAAALDCPKTPANSPDGACPASKQKRHQQVSLSALSHLDTDSPGYEVSRSQYPGTLRSPEQLGNSETQKHIGAAHAMFVSCSSKQRITKSCDMSISRPQQDPKCVKALAMLATDPFRSHTEPKGYTDHSTTDDLSRRSCEPPDVVLDAQSQIALLLSTPRTQVRVDRTTERRMEYLSFAHSKSACRSLMGSDCPLVVLRRKVLGLVCSLCRCRLFVFGTRRCKRLIAFLVSGCKGPRRVSEVHL